jgi:hypothetical protein
LANGDFEDENPDVGWLQGTPLLTRFEVAETAIARAHGLRDDLAAAQGSGLADYVESAKERALPAMIDLCKVDPRDAYEILRLQKEIAAYADVMSWITDVMQRGEEAENEREEIVTAAEAAYRERDEENGT